jgi:hypothetical protein
VKVVNRRSRPRPCRIEMGRRTDSRERQAPRREMTGNLGSNLGGLILWAAMPWPWGVSKAVDRWLDLWNGRCVMGFSGRSRARREVRRDRVAIKKGKKPIRILI